MKTEITKVVRLGTVKAGYPERQRDIFATVEFADGKLSISGVVGPKANGDCHGSCGQFIGSFKEYDARGHLTLADVTPAPAWNADSIKRFFDVWKAWHLNDMRAGCQHQRAEKWEERPIDPSKPTTAYGKHFPGQRYDSWNMLAWVRQDEHPEGLLSRPCHVCGYKYGTNWLREDVPADALEFLATLPDADKQPAWV